MDEGCSTSSSDGPMSSDDEIIDEQAAFRAFLTTCREKSMSWSAIAKEANCSVKSLAQRRKLMCFEDPCALTDITDADLDGTIAALKQEYPFITEDACFRTMVQTHKGIRVTEARIRDSIRRVDPEGEWKPTVRTGVTFRPTPKCTSSDPLKKYY